MSSLNDKTATGEWAWDKYVRKNPLRASLAFQLHPSTSEYTLYEQRGTLFTTGSETIRQNQSFRIIDSKLYQFGNETQWVKVRTDMSGREGFLPIDVIKKPGRNSPTTVEHQAIKRLNVQLQKIGCPISIYMDNRNIGNDIVKAVQIPNNHKADFCLVDRDGRSTVFVSHKNGGGADRFQQYTGVSAKAGSVIHRHPEVQAFIYKVRDVLVTNGLRLPRTMAEHIADERLIRLAVYGSQYTGQQSFGNNHVQVVGCGTPTLYARTTEFAYDLKFSDLHVLNPDIRPFTSQASPYRAVLVAFTSSQDRMITLDNQTYTGIRVGIYPQAFLQGRR
jgi:hypothetical protein